MTENELEVSWANSVGLINGTSAPQFLATFAISLSSVLTITLSITLELTAASILQAINGLPSKFLTFLRGSPFEPPRAGMRASKFICGLGM